MERGIADTWPVTLVVASTGAGITGASANITATLYKDGSTSGAATTDTNPTELGGGTYQFNMSSTENNVTQQQILIPEYSGTGVIIPENRIRYPRPTNFQSLGIESDGDLTQVNDVANQVSADVVSWAGNATSSGDAAIDTMRGTDSALLASSAPSNFSSLEISSGGSITSVNTVDLVSSQVSANVISWAGEATSSGNAAIDTMRGTDSALLASSAPANFSSLGISSGGSVISVNTVDLVSSVSGQVSADVISWAGNTTSSGNAAIDVMRGTDSALLASSAPTNFSSLEISSSGIVDSDAIKISNSSSAADNLEANISNLDATVSSRSTLTTAGAQASAYAALDQTIPSTPTSTSINDYIKKIKFSVINQWIIDEATGDLEIYDDSNVLFATIPGAFTSAVGDTTRKRLL